MMREWGKYFIECRYYNISLWFNFPPDMCVVAVSLNLKDCSSLDILVLNFLILILEHLLMIINSQDSHTSKFAENTLSYFSYPKRFSYFPFLEYLIHLSIRWIQASFARKFEYPTNGLLQFLLTSCYLL